MRSSYWSPTYQLPAEREDRLVDEILKSGPEATRAAKRLAREHPADGEELARIAAGLRSGDEGQEGLRAFLHKRNPRWIP